MELFETFDDCGEPLGLVPRDEVHRQGLWHRSAQVFVFNQLGELLITQRSAEKDLYATQWDYSVGEHLRPGEQYVDAAQRGLSEELGIVGVNLTALNGEIRSTHATDREMQRAYLCQYDGEITPDPEEVAAVRFVDRPTLLDLLHTLQFTPWFVDHLRRFDIIERIGVNAE